MECFHLKTELPKVLWLEATGRSQKVFFFKLKDITTEMPSLYTPFVPLLYLVKQVLQVFKVLQNLNKTLVLKK